jgi:hypothetical protein
MFESPSPFKKEILKPSVFTYYLGFASSGAHTGRRARLARRGSPLGTVKAPAKRFASLQTHCPTLGREP